MRPLAQRSDARRGAATVEFALIIPVLVMILMFSMYLTELVRAKLKLQEFARYTVWEMTSYTLSDFANAKHDEAFTDAQREMMEEAVERYKDLDSVESNAPPGNFVARYSEVQGTVHNKEVPFFEQGLVLGNDAGGLGSSVVGAVNAGANQLLGNVWDFNTKGWVQSEVSMKFNDVLIPQSYLDQGGQGGFFKVDPLGGKNIRSLALQSRFSMYADPWAMDDGADATIRGRRAGAHRSGPENMPHGLYKQVDRMVFLGLRSELEEAVGGIGQFRQFLQSFSPAFLGTFVVSHNYGPSPSGDSASTWGRECIGEDTGIESYPAQAEGGLNNLNKFSQIDWPRPTCFETAPFRDQPYDKSQYIQIFKARGDHFMGCKNAQATDPSAPKSDEGTKGDESKAYAIDCE
ncbi:TadE/TadG family type IV pilus assembly protein [Hyalangium versicolor]|uniref:TadE/TadG family type IV pilus assembly protein n=1 Tax=Hyalangium versicolor TaxID=2861190 RepID=UPI001CCCFCB0|nr:TadE/TadG family type IV pilus assembly protein [Hyalangium versicolor]